MTMRSRLPLALALALGSSSAFALGLGQIEVRSALNQPLSADIPVISTLPGEAESLTVRLAPPEALARVGLPAPTGVAANLEFSVRENDRGQKVIHVSTSSKVSDPFVTFLLEVDWGKGKMLREYTVLLDPPTMAPVRRQPVAAAPVAEVEPAPTEALPEAPPPPAMETRPEPAPEPVRQPEPEPGPAPMPPVSEEPRRADSVLPPRPDAPSRVDSYGPVVAGETLWAIATYARPDESVSMNQMMMAMLYANPDAFIDQNINRLKKGAVLRIPTREEALAIAAADAAAQVREQIQVWRAQTQPVRQPAEPQPGDDSGTRNVAAQPTRTDSRLELVPPRGDASGSGPQSGAAAGGEGRELRAELARSREEISALSAENVELKSRVGELEKMQQDRDRLISLKDSELAAAQQRLAELEARRQAAGEVVADASALADAPADPAADGTADDGTEVASEAPATEPAPVSTPAPVAETPAPAPAEPLPVPAAKPWYMSPWVMGGGGLVVVGLLALLLGRRKKAPVPKEASRYAVSASAAAAADAAADDYAEEQAAEDYAEAAEDTTALALADAVAADPGNLTRHLELVRHYYDIGDAAGFEQAAEAMYARVYDPDHLAWKQVMAMGHEIAPEHPLFAMAPESDPVEGHEAEPAYEPTPEPAPAPSEREIDWGIPVSQPDIGTTQTMQFDDFQPSTPEPEPAADVLDNDGFIDADAAATKLELARAYLDMGDVDGARGMLEEVVGEGNPGQRAEARRLLDEIR